MDIQDEDLIKKGGPVMPCHPAEGGLPKQLVRGDAPSTPKKRVTAHPNDKTKSKLTRRIKRFFRVNEEEDKIIDDKAAEAGLEGSSYLRVQALGKSVLRACRRIRMDWSALANALGRINRAGNVVNQLVVVLRKNGGTTIPPEVKDALLELRAAAREITQIAKRG